MNRRAQAVVLLLVGWAVLQISLTDVYLRYVKPGLQPFLIAAGALLIAAAAMTLWYQWQRDPAHADHAAGDDGLAHVDTLADGHGHGREPRVGWLLLLPVVVLALAAPQALGADAASRAGTALRAPTSDFDPLPPGDPVAMSLGDYASRAVFDQGRSLENRTVRLTGFVMVGDDGTMYLARIIVTCCAADGRPIKIALTGQVPNGLAPDTWLSVTGGYSPKTIEDPVNGATIPFVDVDEAEKIDQPRNPYQL